MRLANRTHPLQAGTLAAHVATLLILAPSGLAQLTPVTPLTPPSPQKPEKQKARPVIVTATRAEQDPLDVPYSTGTITDADLRARAYRTIPQALRDVPGVMVQETAHGHGSPYIRGFTGFHTLLLIDGVRLNNSVFRPGPNQYWNTVDPFSIERLEIVKGPSSVLYGSDAVGGTVHVLTRSPYAPIGTGFAAVGSTRMRYSSAEDSIQARGEISASIPIGREHLGLLVGGTARSFGDLEGGAGVGTQTGTGYDETDGDLKLEHWLDPDTRIVFLHQRVAQNDVPRTHSTVNGISWRGLSVGSDLRRDFDQNRELTYVQFHSERAGAALDAIHASVSWHRQTEVRNRVRGNGDRELQGMEVGTLGASLQLASQTEIGRLTYGVEFYHDNVDSFLNRLDSPSPADAIQGPVADDATYDMIDAYVQDEFAIAEDIDVTIGGRFSFAAADADSVRDPVTNTRIGIDDDWNAFVGSARFRYRLAPEGLHLFGGVSQGFRAPNLSDLTRFDTARTNEFEIPAPGLDPEEYVSYEIGLKARTDGYSFETSYFYTDIEDQILRFPTGNTNASGENEVSKGNVGDGHVYGIEVGGAYRLNSSTSVFGNATYMEGRVTNFSGPSSMLQETYLTRLMPLTVQAGVRWEQTESPFWLETAVVHAEVADKLSFDDVRDSSRIPPGGTPGYTVWHVRSGWQITDSTSFELLLENLTDVDYRVHGSGLNRPGRNIIVGFQSNF